MASSSTAVPVTLTSAYAGKSERSTPSPTRAAWWHTASIPASASSTAAWVTHVADDQIARRVRPAVVHGGREGLQAVGNHGLLARMVSAMCDPMSPAHPLPPSIQLP